MSATPRKEGKGNVAGCFLPDSQGDGLKVLGGGEGPAEEATEQRVLGNLARGKIGPVLTLENEMKMCFE